ncbi:indolepyruvate oxidoreductase subunit beta [Succinivibrio sp.]|uniref:indolepyruvate oxidoreductase subunit beta n=1 Tax=Succinivibrio sp. TaxID=2053619 RepID=UPI0025ECAC94|nr:indolepyruvate oxidoreductase subunit beta [Succinivibrio sp.]MBQ9221793.1 indolepyruvate oxidoreductase subunit beta [Succinivibrio sp.]
MNKNILICGVGGQGTVLSSRILASAFMSEGHTVHSAETIGMAQRGGSVVSHVRVGDEVFSPLIPKGRADLILAFEPGEAAGCLKYLTANGSVILNSHPIPPVTVSLKGGSYNEKGIFTFLSSQKIRHATVSSDELIKKFGSVKYFNILILGVASGMDVLGVSAQSIESQIEKLVKEKFVAINKEVFNAGYEIGLKNAAE